MLYADDTCIVSRSPRGLGRIMTVFVEEFGIFGLPISESKAETMCISIQRAPADADSLQRDGATVPPDHLLRLLGRHR